MTTKDPGTSGTARKRNVEAVLFDFGGVIVDGPFDAFERYEQTHGLREGFIRSLNTTNPHDNAWARFERNEISFDDFCDSFEEEARLAGGEMNTRELFASFSGAVRPEMVEAVRRCSASFKTALLTNNFLAAEATARGSRPQHAEVIAMFDLVVESSVTGLRKPDPEFYLLACRELEVDPTSAVFLDDLGVNLKPARALGMATIKVETTSQALEELESVLGLPMR